MKFFAITLIVTSGSRGRKSTWKGAVCEETLLAALKVALDDARFTPAERQSLRYEAKELAGGEAYCLSK